MLNRKSKEPSEKGKEHVVTSPTTTASVAADVAGCSNDPAKAPSILSNHNNNVTTSKNDPNQHSQNSSPVPMDKSSSPLPLSKTTVTNPFEVLANPASHTIPHPPPSSTISANPQPTPSPNPSTVSTSLLEPSNITHSLPVVSPPSMGETPHRS
ncbi:PREDICTED: WASH complex subunit CCDC53 homolog [Camelina sativa]|uniref:WASH complex subunit CCDC53 homolog n=1 Tax=Camelina sativa TaxID=90675 RepID=A0ABM0Y5A2_CAMSA|nr:PREDICTED: WASH complex subunit CCDC53 homolog [Camelina sativa]